MSYSLRDLVALGGPVMWLLLLCSVLAATLIAERFLIFSRLQLNTRRFLEEITDTLKRHKVAEALALCDRSRGPIAQLVRVGLLHHGRSRDEIRQAIEDAGHRALPPLERNLAPLGTLAHVAPLLGLLGTCLGLIRCFHTLQAKTSLLQPVGPGELAGGVWQALLTTTAGLGIAIPAIVAYNYFARRIQQVIWEMEIAAADLLQLLTGEG